MFSCSIRACMRSAEISRITPLTWYVVRFSDVQETARMANNNMITERILFFEPMLDAQHSFQIRKCHGLRCNFVHAPYGNQAREKLPQKTRKARTDLLLRGLCCSAKNERSHYLGYEDISASVSFVPHTHVYLNRFGLARITGC